MKYIPSFMEIAFSDSYSFTINFSMTYETIKVQPSPFQFSDMPTMHYIMCPMDIFANGSQKDKKNSV